MSENSLKRTAEYSIYPLLARCPGCSTIAAAVSASGNADPCPYCDVTYEGGGGSPSKGIWPHSNIRALLKELHRLSHIENRFRSAELILYCSVIEGILVDFLLEYIDKYPARKSPSSESIRKASGLGGKLNQFKLLTGSELRKELEALEYGDWYSDIFIETNLSGTRGLYLKRNDCVHGPTALSHDNSVLDRIDKSRSQCLDVFISLNNWAIENAERHRMTITEAKQNVAK